MSRKKHGEWIKKHATFLAVLAGVVLIDRLIKELALVQLAKKTIDFGFFSLFLTYNKGVAFGLLSSMQIFVIIFSGLVVLLGIFFINRFDKKYKIPIALILGGAAGNLIDRLVYGYVIDYISVPYFSVFNFADTCITIGAILLLWHSRNQAR